jgi:2-polyprenyl-3-methyl-5-hydroxy-6-metoxy-1,4-benzoquinol methylase
MDRFQMYDGFEDPGKWERSLKQAFEDAKTDKEIAAVLRYAFLEEAPQKSFRHFQELPVVGAISRLLSMVGVDKLGVIADVGCGRGHLAYALHQIGYQNLTAMDPNGNLFTGTAYLKSLKDHHIEIVNDLCTWRETVGKFDAIISAGTVHHWQHIPQVAIDCRRTMKPGAYWLMISEFYARTPREFLSLLTNHPTAKKYGSYEWAYPASVYADLIQSVGFKLVGVIPWGYNKNEFLYSPTPLDPKLTSWVDRNLLKPEGTVKAFWNEVDLFRRFRLESTNYLVPQVMIFQRVDVEDN